ncbi:unnamed protein product, partial [Brachionus calyciflorus]
NNGDKSKSLNITITERIDQNKIDDCSIALDSNDIDEQNEQPG